MPLVAIYPKEGTLVADHPYAVLNAPWGDDQKRAAASSFLDYLRSPDAQRAFLAAGVRDGAGRAGAAENTPPRLLPDEAEVNRRPPAPAGLRRTQKEGGDVPKPARA